MIPTPLPGHLLMFTVYLYLALGFLFSNSKPFHRGIKIKQNAMVGVHRCGICSTDAFSMDTRVRQTFQHH